MSQPVNDKRLNKYIADSGYCSRREADRLISEGKVKVNGQVASIGQRVSEADHIVVEKQVIHGSGDKVYLAVNKPRGIVCTTDPREPMNIATYINFPGRIYPIGRLDKDSEGLLLMTSDGDIVNRILRAAGRHEKEYEVSVDKPITADFLARMAKGLPILGQVTLPCRIHKTGPGSFRIILVQGLNRQIRRMCEFLGYRVVHLRRVRIMHITLGGMRPGNWRLLSNNELKQLMKTLDEKDEGQPGALSDQEE